MKTGATTLELDVTYQFTNDGEPTLHSVCLGMRQLPAALANRLLVWMNKPEQDALIDEAWSNAEDDDSDGDAACDEARAEVAG